MDESFAGILDKKGGMKFCFQPIFHYLCLMKLKFSINYHTIWGQSLHVVITYTGVDGRQKSTNLLMTTDDGAYWTAETALMESRRNPVVAFSYYYQVEDAEGEVVRREWRGVERLYAADSSKNYVFPDSWRDIPLQHHLYTLAYSTTTGNQQLQEVEAKRMPLYRKTVIFRVAAPQLQPGEMLAVCGNHPAIGDWNPARFLLMTPIGGHDWMLSVNVDGMAFPLEYKYVVVDVKTHTLKTWEEGDNRSTGAERADDGQVLVLYGETLRVKEPTWRLAGVVVPLFSLRSEHSYGVGDFGDLKRMVDWAAETGMKMIQLLPLNDTTTTHGWTDSQPYNAISAFALHPHFLDLEQMGQLDDADRMTIYHRQRRELNAYSYCDYPSVHRVKTDYVAEMFRQEGRRVMQTDDFKSFYEANSEWLVPYAAFCVLRDIYGTARFSEWPQLSVYNRKEVESFCQNHADVQLVFYVQFNLWKQFRDAALYARSKGVALKGDLAIGVGRDSVETWMHPYFFHMDAQAGTPPDKYQPNGQNWGFPTFDWDSSTSRTADRRMNLYDWFACRFRWMEQFFDAFRIDHVVGFFRMWEVPDDCINATLGHFAPSLPMSEEEIGHFGLVFRRDLMTRPLINDRVLQKFFGMHADYVREHFLMAKAYGLYDLRSDFDSQLKVVRHFEGRNDENSLWIKEGLMRLLQNVLFLEDRHQSGMYHPRFGVYNETVYEVLTAEEKDAFMRLYNNYFYERHNAFWGHLAYRKLYQLMCHTHMLMCAEDLGMLPQCVEPTLSALRVLSLDIQDMPKQHGYEFAHLDAYPYLSVATFSTHDMSPMRLWWEENPGRTQRYFTTMLQKQGRAPKALTAALAEEMIARHLYCPSAICVFLLQDWLAMDASLRGKNLHEERINLPEDPFNQWRYRMHLNVEELMEAKQFNAKVRTMISRSQR